MYKLIKNCRTKQEALDKCNLKIGQFIRIVGLRVQGSIDGYFTVHPILELVREACPRCNGLGWIGTGQVCPDCQGPAGLVDER